MRIQVHGDCPTALALRGNLTKAGFRVSKSVGMFSMGYTVNVSEYGGAYIHVDGIDCELERYMVNSIAALTETPILLKRAGGVQSDREIRIRVPMSDEDQKAVELGVVRGLLLTVGMAKPVSKHVKLPQASTVAVAIIVLSLMFMFTLSVKGQQLANTVTRLFAGAPTNPCTAFQLAKNAATGHLYSCNQSTLLWVDIGPSSGTGSQHQVNGINVTSNDPINFIDSASVSFTNPSAGNITATASGSTPRLDQVLDPNADKTFAMGNRKLEFDNGLLGLNISPTALFDIQSNSTISPIQFFGSGLNDATEGGVFVGTGTPCLAVVIDATGTPDTFQWGDDCGATFKQTGVAITGADQVLEDGVTIKFSATTGHTLADEWDIHATEAIPLRIYDTSGAQKVLFHQNANVDYGNRSPFSWRLKSSSRTDSLIFDSTGVTLSTPWSATSGASIIAAPLVDFSNGAIGIIDPFIESGKASTAGTISEYDSYQANPVFTSPASVTLYRGFYSTPTGTSTIQESREFDASGYKGTTSYGYYTNAVAAANRWAFYGAGTAASHFGGTSDAPIFNATTGFQVNGAAALANVLRGNGTNFVSAALSCADLSDEGTGCAGAAYPGLVAHNLLSVSHGDTTASSAVRGGAIFAVGASPTWTQVAHSATTGGYWKWNGTDVVASTGAAGGTGSCTNQFVTAENADAAPNCTSATLASAQFANQGTTTTVLHGNAAGNPSWAGVSLANDTVANQGTTTTVLHGNAAGQPSFGAVVEADLSLSNNTTANVSTTAHGLAPILPNDASKFLNGTGNYTAPTASLPSGLIVFIDSGTCPTGFTEVAGLSGKFILGTTAAGGDVGTTGGSSSYTPQGTNGSSAVSGIVVDNHADHTHNYTQVPNHVHVQNLPSSQTGSQASGTRDTSTTGSTADALSTANPTGGVATAVTLGSNSTLTHNVSNNGTAAAQVFTGTAATITPPYMKLIGCKSN